MLFMIFAIVVVYREREGLYRFCRYPFPFIMCPTCDYPCFFKGYQLIILNGTIITGLIGGRVYCGSVCPVGSIQNWLASLKRSLFSLASKSSQIRFKSSVSGLSGKVVLLQNLTNRATKSSEVSPKSSWKAVIDKAWKRLDGWLRFLKYPFILIVILYSLNRFAMGWGFMPEWGILPGAKFALQVRGLAGPGYINFWLLILITVFIIGLFIHRPWCKYLCPIGLLFAVFNRISFLKIKLGGKGSKRCTGCRKCLEKCTTGQPLSKLERGFASVECVRCYDCVLACPEGAAKIKPRFGK